MVKIGRIQIPLNSCSFIIIRQDLILGGHLPPTNYSFSFYRLGGRHRLSHLGSKPSFCSCWMCHFRDFKKKHKRAYCPTNVHPQLCMWFPKVPWFPCSRAAPCHLITAYLSCTTEQKSNWIGLVLIVYAQSTCYTDKLQCNLALTYDPSPSWVSEHLSSCIWAVPTVGNF